MARKLFALIAAASTPLLMASSWFDIDTVPPLKGNDTGGIIAYSPEAARLRERIAADHCARWNKIHRITSVHAQYGDYIGFHCYWPRGTNGIVVRGRRETTGVVVRRAY